MSNSIVTQDSDPQVWAEMYDIWDGQGKLTILIYMGDMYQAENIDEHITFIRMSRNAQNGSILPGAQNH